MKYEYKASELIASAFKKHGVVFHDEKHITNEVLTAGFAVRNGPNLLVKFIVPDNDNDTAVRAYSIASNIQENKRARILEACNIINCKTRHVKFCLDKSGDINVEYDLPINSPDEQLGEMAYEMLCRFIGIITEEYELLMKAIYTDEKLDTNPTISEQLDELLSDSDIPNELRQLLEGLTESNENDEDEDNDDDSNFDDDDDDKTVVGEILSENNDPGSLSAFLRMLSNMKDDTDED